MASRVMTALALALWACWVSPWTLAREEAQISKLSDLDRQFMAQQRELIQDLASTNLGRHFNGDRDNDLDILQTLLDRRLVRPEQTRELQAMGVIMGDQLAADLTMHWVIYEDRLGRSRALRFRQTDNYLFPITMISRRREVGNETSVEVIYEKAYNVIDAVRPALPFR